VGEPGRWTIVYEADETGVAAGGAIYLQVSPFWGWSTPQTVDPSAPGFTEVSTNAAGVDLRAETIDRGLLAVSVAGRPMVAGERVRLVYGAGPAGAMPDRYAERDSPLWVAVDGNGDGIRSLLSRPLTVDVAPGAPARLSLIAPSYARPGEPVRLRLAVLDAAGNAWPEYTGAVRLAAPEGVEVTAEVHLASADRGTTTVEARVDADGVYRIVASSGEMTARSNPLVTSANAPRLAWADLHGHSQLSDGTATPEDYLAYARDVAGLDVIALTDHDHWGMQPLALHPQLWEAIREATEEAHEPDRFVTLLGYEWTSWIHGHRHVLYFGDDGEVLDSTLREYEHPRQLWDALRDRNALTFAHHSAGGPVATNWAIPPDPELEPVTEIVSVHGVSEAMDAPRVLHGPVEGNFVRDVLGLGYRLGFIGSGDTHDGHPGLGHLAAPTGGLAGLFVDGLSRDAVRQALGRRHAYATSGPRIVLRVALAGRPMGSAIPAAELAGETSLLWIEAHGTEALEAVEIVRSGEIVARFGAEEDDSILDLQLTEEVEDLASGEYLYVRVLQQDGHAAWSSPFFVE